MLFFFINIVNCLSWKCEYSEFGGVSTTHFLYKEDNVNIPLTIHSIMNGDLWYRRDILNNYVKQKNTNINIKITANDKTFDMFSLKEKQIIAFASQGYTNKANTNLTSPDAIHAPVFGVTLPPIGYV